MTAELPGHDRCPQCGAAIRPGAPFCTLCHADLRPKPEPEPLPLPALDVDPPAAPAYTPSVVAGPDPLTAPLDPETGEIAGPTWPCHSCGTRNRIERDTCSGCGSPFLSGLREQEGPLLELPVVGDITRLGRGQRFALAGGVVLFVILLTLLVGLFVR
jgi:hypothetical protein